MADISIGTNAVAEALARPGREVVRTAARTAVGEPPRLDLDDGAVGAVVSATGIGGPLSGEFFREVARVLAPGGAFAFLTADRASDSVSGRRPAGAAGAPTRHAAGLPRHVGAGRLSG
ncbi:MAG: hypothetical protein IPM11_00465 [Micropruina sp.]|nr:hypothetical protein [Micropruina sp.]